MPSPILSILARPGTARATAASGAGEPTAPGPVPPLPLPVLGDGVAVPLADGTETGYAALDYAASAPALRAVWDEVADYLPYYGSVHRGAGYLSRLSTDLFEAARGEVAAFLGLRPGDQVLFTRSTTDSLGLLAAALPPGTEVFVFATEHHAALLPWYRRADTAVTCLPAPRSPREAVRTLTEALTLRPGDGPALVCVTGASNVTGEVWPVRDLAAAAHANGARLVLDAAQLAPHHPVDAAALGADWVAFSGHKLYAPFGAGVLAGRTDWLDAAEPYLAGGGATAAVAPRDGGGFTVDWHTGTARHEAGSPNVVGAHAIAAACRALTAAGRERLADRERRLTARVLDGLAALPGVRVLSLFGAGAQRVGVVSFTVEGHDSAALAGALSERYGIGVRDGLFCAHPLVRLLTGGAPDTPGACGGPAGAGAGPRGAVRVSFGAGTPDEHIERFLTALGALLAED